VRYDTRCLEGRVEAWLATAHVVFLTARLERIVTLSDDLEIA